MKNNMMCLKLRESEKVIVPKKTLNFVFITQNMFHNLESRITNLLEE